jgi:hypothetical protein
MMKKTANKSVRFTAEIHRFEKKGEKTGWTYIEIPAKVADTLMPGNKKSFRVKGKLDNHQVNEVALLPMGEGDFILPFNAAIRKGTGKVAGQTVVVVLEPDKKELTLNKEMMRCIKDEPDAFAFFKQLTRSHQNYFSKWVDGAKSNETKAKRIASILNALIRKMNYGEMIRAKI